MPAVRDAIQKGMSVLTIDAFQTGGAVAPRDRSVKHFAAFNSSDDAAARRILSRRWSF